MSKFKSPEELLSYKGESLKKKKISILVGMGTCGIAAGAKKVYDIFLDEIKNKDLRDVEVKQVGCLGLCFSEPNIEIQIDGMPDVLYGKIDEELARQIIKQHVIRGVILDSNIYDKPYIDILK
jgi:NADP-reducing hydrogenase subunit HndB